MVETETVFGEQIRLLGYDYHWGLPGEGTVLLLILRFYWQPLQTPATDYHVFVHLVSEDDTNPLAQSDGLPGRSEARPTSTWDDTSEIFISHEFAIPLPDTSEAQSYRLLVGLYDWRTGERLLTDAGQETVEIPISVGENE
jgi:hypothetical protein